MFAAKDTLLTRPSGGAYQISRSVRFRSSASAYFNRTPPLGAGGFAYTISTWVKRGTLGTLQAICSANYTNTVFFDVIFNTGNTLDVNLNAGVGSEGFVSTSVYRDPSAWYHIMIVGDPQNATATNRLKVFVNGVAASGTYVYPTLGFATSWNIGTRVHGIGVRPNTTFQWYFDGYMAEFNSIDGQALTPSSFGETNPVTGVWQPKAYSGTYGTNGFYLNFSDNSTAAALGTDFSGNSNTWTVNNISVTAGVTYDSMLDVPTPYADGGNGRGNYPTWNPLTAGGLVTFSEANLKALSTSASAPYSIESTIKTATTGKWYAEVTVAAGANNPAVGIGNNPSTSNSNTDQWAAYRTNATYITGGVGASSSGTPATFTTNDVIGIAYDVGAGTLVFYKNGTLQTGGFTGITAGNYSFIVRKDSATGDGGYLNCGQRPFSYTPPTGFVALNTQNLPEPTISNGANYMAATLYAANGSTQTISNAVNGVSMQPDFVWVKSRQYTTVGHSLFDALRPIGVNTSLPRLVSNSTDAETNNGGLTAFVSNGFSLNNDAYINSTSTGGNMVAWQWNAGGSTVTNTDGTISAQVRANTTAGFSIVTYNAVASGASTVGHGLGVAPMLVINKGLDALGSDWLTYHVSLAATTFLNLRTTAAAATNAAVYPSAPSSTVVNLGTGMISGNYGTRQLLYCFAPVAGYSAFGSYTGNGSADGPFVYLGFRPRFVMLKRTDSANNWVMFDTSRDTYNAIVNTLSADSTNNEAAFGAGYNIDFLSNGFKPRNTTGAENASGGTYIYMAFAENPFKISLAR
jgi:hypothetical protein